MKAAWLFPLVLAVAAPAAAQPASAPTARDAVKKNNPDRLMCEREEQIGSRLAAKKVCLTAREWQMRRQEMREDLERYQRESASPRSE